MSNIIKYRPDIDGLRAIAVLSVIVFHIWHDALPGGFIGVDVFFVISGYLISLQLYKEMQTNSFSITKFYERRIKRILPVFYVVVLLTVVVAQFIMVPFDAEKVGVSAIWALISSANVYFWLFQDNSYFAQSSDESPLLHLWSLGVEEQFYLLWPLLLLFLFKYKKPKLILIFAVCLTFFSLCLAEFSSKNFSDFSYYMLPTRMGEMLVGALAAYWVFYGQAPVLTKKIAFLFSLLGLLGLVFSIAFIDKSFVFPGFIVLIPILSTALIIYTGNFYTGFVHRALSIKPLVFIGLISYSAYLWHWPILAFYRYGNFEITLLSGCVILLITLLLAKLSHKFVEVPFRKVKLEFRTVLKWFVIIPSLVVFLFSFLVYRSHGFGIRYLHEDYKAAFYSMEEAVKGPHKSTSVCQFPLLIQENITEARCLIGADSIEEPRILLLGDSNAGHLVGTFDVLGKDIGVSMRNIAISSCPPLLYNAERYATRDKEACANSIRVLMPYITNYDHLIISAAWTNYLSGKKDDAFWKDLTLTLNKLSTSVKSITLVGKIPWVKGFKQGCALRQLSFYTMNCDLDIPHKQNKKLIDINNRLRAIAANYENINYYDFNDLLCHLTGCIWTNENKLPIYYDFSHLSYFGSEYLGNLALKQKLVPEFLLVMKDSNNAH